MMLEGSSAFAQIRKNLQQFEHERCILFYKCKKFIRTAGHSTIVHDWFFYLCYEIPWNAHEVAVKRAYLSAI